MIFAFLHWDGIWPVVNDARNSFITLPLTAGHTCCHTAVGRPSSPGALQDLAANKWRFTSSSVSSGISTGSLWGRSPSSSIAAGRSGKKVVRSSSACSNLSLVVVLSALSNSGILSNEQPWFGFRYFVACQILASSAKKSIQWSFFCFRIVSWYCLLASFASASSIPSLAPSLCMFLARFLSCVYSLRSRVRSDVHYFFMYGDGLALGVSLCTASETIAVSWLVCTCISPPIGLIASLVEINSHIFFYRAFLNSSLSSLVCSGTATSNVVSIASWSEPWLVSWSLHLITFIASISEARIKSIVNSAELFCQVLVPF